MLKELEKIIQEYSSENKDRGGKAALQRFEAGMGKGKTSDTPLALAICTPPPGGGVPLACVVTSVKVNPQ